MIGVIFNNTADFIWSCFFLPALFLTAIALTVGCRGLQFFRFGFAMKQTVGRAFSKSKQSANSFSPFQAASTALGSTVGTGNIVGTAQAICMGGPGALFWLWCAALISMIVKYAEILLAIHFRQQKTGYGPMDYIEQGLGSKKLALAYAGLALLSSLAMGNITQASSITDSFIFAFESLSKSSTGSDIAARIVLGLIMCGLTIILLSGGAKRVGKFTEALVPFMAILFISVCALVISVNISKLPTVLKTVFIEAFKPGSICAGISGLSTAQCIQWGIRRSAFSNEAGLGTSAIAHASADTSKAAEQGLWGIFEVFADTIVICSCTSLSILCSGISIPWGTLCGSEVFVQAISTVMGQRLSAILLAVFIGLFAYTSIIGWAFYGSRCCGYIFGKGTEKLYYAVFSALLIVGSTMPTGTVWQIADLINAFMSIPNLTAVFLLSPLVCSITKRSFFLTNRL